MWWIRGVHHRNLETQSGERSDCNEGNRLNTQNASAHQNNSVSESDANGFREKTLTVGKECDVLKKNESHTFGE